MSKQPFFGNWMASIAEAAEVAGADGLDRATAQQLERAWSLVCSASELSSDDLARAVAYEAGLGVAALEKIEAHALHVVPAEVAHRRLVMPLRCDDRKLTVATANPFSQTVERELHTVTGREIHLEVAPPAEVHAAIGQAYGAFVKDAAGPPPPVEQVKPEGPHVLVVDDEASTRHLFRSLLEEKGFRVTVAANGLEAVSLLQRANDFDLVTLDYWMSKMNGLRVLQQLRASPTSSHLPVIMVTGSEDRRIEMSLFEAGADDYITKPIDAPLFMLRVAAVLRRPRAS